MILCQRCNQAKATVHINDVVPQKRERHLCEECASKEGIIVKPPFQTTNAILKQFIQHKPGSGGGSGSDTEDRTCPSCGMTWREFQVKGMLGCPEDYDVFRTMLMPLIERAHGGEVRHVGKVPVGADDSMRQKQDLFRLRRELQGAIDSEQYETAAGLRDQIQTIEDKQPVEPSESPESV